MRFVGYGPEEDEWLNVKESIRECSLGIDHSECQILKPGNHVVCFQVTPFPYFSCYCHDPYLLELNVYNIVLVHFTWLIRLYFAKTPGEE